MATTNPGAGALPRECVVIDITESKYKMVRRFNQKLDTKFVGIVWQGMDRFNRRGVESGGRFAWPTSLPSKGLGAYC
jgi:hypothetical protein